MAEELLCFIEKGNVWSVGILRWMLRAMCEQRKQSEALKRKTQLFRYFLAVVRGVSALSHSHNSPVCKLIAKIRFFFHDTIVRLSMAFAVWTNKTENNSQNDDICFDSEENKR